ncbi:MAG: phosphatidylglycerophosphatase A [Desulfobacteraceae bacterium]|jgi:phosphatidylglycerophosphatase A
MSEPQSDSLTFRDAFRKADISKKSALCFASWFGAGLMPVAPGTFGTLMAVPLVLFLNHLGALYEGLALLLLVPLAIWSSNVCERCLGRNDPPEVVVDEVAGFLLTLFLLPLSWLTLCLGFVLFRVFDIAKPFPIRWFEKKLRGGTGVVLDDLMAGVYANLGLRLLMLWIS